MGDDEALLEQVSDLCAAGRYRSAMDVALDRLSDGPTDELALRLADVVLTTCQTEMVAAAEPLTPDQHADARLNGLAAQCSECDRFWYPGSIVGHYVEVVRTRPSGQQCPTCGLTMCAQHVPADQICPVPGCGASLTASVRPTGRRAVRNTPDSAIEAIVVIRAGPIPPTQEEVLGLLRWSIPMTANLERRVTAFANPDGQVTTDAVYAQLSAMESQGHLAPLSADRTDAWSQPYDGQQYTVVVVARDGVWRAIRDHLSSHLRRALARPGAKLRRDCWNGLNSASILDASTDLALSAIKQSVSSGQHAICTAVHDGYYVAASSILEDDVAVARAHFEGGYAAFLESLVAEAGLPESGLSLAHWTICSTGSADVITNLTFAPADTAEELLIATDLLS